MLHIIIPRTSGPCLAMQVALPMAAAAQAECRKATRDAPPVLQLPPRAGCLLTPTIRRSPTLLCRLLHRRTPAASPPLVGRPRPASSPAAATQQLLLSVVGIRAPGSEAGRAVVEATMVAMAVAGMRGTYQEVEAVVAVAVEGAGASPRLTTQPRSIPAGAATPTAALALWVTALILVSNIPLTRGDTGLVHTWCGCCGSCQHFWGFPYLPARVGKRSTGHAGTQLLLSLQVCCSS
jgi:hypothetical protein